LRNRSISAFSLANSRRFWMTFPLVPERGCNAR
jgi:hypothetical protein